MSKKFCLTILILIVILTSVLYWYFNYYSLRSLPPEITEEKVEPKDKSFQTIELEKPPFIKD